MRSRPGGSFFEAFACLPRARSSCESVSTARRRAGYSKPADTAPIVIAQRPGSGRRVSSRKTGACTPRSLKKLCSTDARRSSAARTTTRQPCLR